MLLSKTLHSSTLKLAFIYVIVFSFVIFTIIGYAYWSAMQYVADKSDQNVMTEYNVLAGTYRRLGKNNLVALIDRRLVDPYFSEWKYLLTDPSLNYVAGNLKLWPVTLRTDKNWGSFVAGEWQQESTDRTLVRATYQLLPDGSHLLVGRKADDRKLLSKKIRTSLVWAASAFFVLAAAAGISTSRRSVARIEEIIATSREIIRTGLRERIPLRGTGDEWDGLADNLNSMLDRIEDLVEANQQVSDSVAHDLRTPLTRIRGRLEKAYGQQLDLDQHHALIGDVITQLDEVLRTFASLLRITQIERADRKNPFQTIDLTEIAREVVELFDPAAEENFVRLRITVSEPLNVDGDRDLLFDAISNLVDNAIKHSGGGGEVTIALSHRADGPVLSVADRGPGIPVEEHRNVLRRFYRLERSRNSPGNGLGLSLVAAVVNLHDARLVMANNSPGLKIELHFPTRKNGSRHCRSIGSDSTPLAAIRRTHFGARSFRAAFLKIAQVRRPAR
ncbi:MAG: sensor histidine kinase [Stellaceae bacterium]